MKITETFVADILKAEYPMDYQKIYDKSPMLQYFGKYLCDLFYPILLSKGFL